MSSIPQAKPSQDLFPRDLNRENINLVPLTKKMVKKAARSLAVAFFNYPMIEYLFPNEKSRLKRSYHYFKGLINYGRLFGTAYAISQEAEGIIILLSATMAHFPNKEVLRSGIPLQFALSGVKFLLRTRIHEPHQYSIYKKNTNFPHKYFMLLGVHPDKQGSGYANVLINRLVEICDKEKLPCYLETYLEKNVQIYKKFGFKVVEESVIPKTTVKFWGLLRHNR